MLRMSFKYSVLYICCRNEYGPCSHLYNFLSASWIRQMGVGHRGMATVGCTGGYSCNFSLTSIHRNRPSFRFSHIITSLFPVTRNLIRYRSGTLNFEISQDLSKCLFWRWRFSSQSLPVDMDPFSTLGYYWHWRYILSCPALLALLISLLVASRPILILCCLS